MIKLLLLTAFCTTCYGVITYYCIINDLGCIKEPLVKTGTEFISKMRLITSDYNFEQKFPLFL